MAISVSYGLGRHNVFLDPSNNLEAQKFLFVSQPPYAWALMFAKIAVCLTLLRILRESRAWRWFLYAMIVFQVCIAATINSFQLSLCKPISAIWDPSVPNPVCMPASTAQASIYATSAATILTDFILSSIPLTFIVQLQRPLREKIAIACIMGLGVLGGCASIYKTTLVPGYGITGDTLTDGVDLTIWSILEMQLGCVTSLSWCPHVLGDLALTLPLLQHQRSLHSGSEAAL